MRSNTKFKVLIFAVICLFSAVFFNAQVKSVKTEISTKEETGLYIFKTEDSYFFVLNREKDSYRIQFKGDNLVYQDRRIPWFFTIDGKFLKLLNVLNKNFWKPKAGVKTEPTEDELLEAHKIWESKFLGEKYGAELSVTSEIFEIQPGKKVMYWSFPVQQKFAADFSHRSFLTTVVGKDIVALSGAPKSSDEEKAVREYLIQTMKFLKVSSEPFNIKELRSLHEEVTPGEDNL